MYLVKGGRSEYNHIPVIDNIDDAHQVVIIDGAVSLSSILLHQGFKWLDHWEVIVPFRPYHELAEDFVKGKSKKSVKQLNIGDLRVPVFDPKLIFMRTTPRAKRLWHTYNAMKQQGWDYRIAFLAAVWEHKPHLKPLPAQRWLK